MSHRNLLSDRETARELVGLLRQIPHSPERARHILRMVRIAEGAERYPEDTPDSPFCDAAAFCERNGVS